jgi:hypothetical protein
VSLYNPRPARFDFGSSGSTTGSGGSAVGVRASACYQETLYGIGIVCTFLVNNRFYSGYPATTKTNFENHKCRKAFTTSDLGECHNVEKFPG